MHRPFARYYIYCQAIGWGAVAAVILIFGPMNASKWLFLAGFMLPGLLATHLLRYCILRYHWLDLSLRQSLTRLLLALLLTVAAAALMRSPFLSFAHFPGRLLACAIEYSFVIAPWLILYFSIHQVLDVRELTKKIQRLEALVKEKETSTAGSGIDIEDLTGTLDRIRSLIDLDPNSARREITTFSRLLRSGHLKS